MKLWHNTDDAPRLPEGVRSGQTVEIWVGTYPIESGQHVKVEWSVTHLDEAEERGHLPALWRYNEFGASNSYWLATIGPFQRGDQVEYKITGTSGGSTISSETYSFKVE